MDFNILYRYFPKQLSLKAALGLALSFFIIAILLTILFLYFIGVFGRPSITESQYKAEKAETQKAIQAALSQAEKDRREAELIKAANEKLAAQYIERDKNRAAEFQKSDQERIKQNERIKADFANDVDGIVAMPDKQRDADICARWERLYRSNPALEQFRCK